MAIPPNSESILLRLPPELRNKIYRLALVSPTAIYIPSSAPTPPQQPGILRTNRQVRREALLIWLRENRFLFDCPDFDARNLIQWTALSAGHRRSTASFSRVSVGRGPVWENLREWLKARHEGRVRKRPSASDPHGGAAARCAGRVFEAAKKLRAQCGLGWEEIEPILEDIRLMLAVVDRRWA